MRDFIPSLVQSEGGKRFILNLYWALLDGLDYGLARALITKAEAAEASGFVDPFFPDCGKFRSVVYEAPADYQFRGRSEIAARGRWMTVKRADDLRKMVEQGLGNDADRFAEVFPRLSLGDSIRGKPDEIFREIAAAINDRKNALDFPLGIERSNRQCPTWFTRWCVFEDVFNRLPPSQAAGRLRDWLGLPFTDEPLFAVRTRNCFEVKKLVGHRPTILDGFEGPLFKHPTGSGFPWIGCGSAADIKLLRQREVVEDVIAVIDGGPELVSNSARFSADAYECVFLGRATDLDYDLFGEFHNFLLPDGWGVDDVTSWIINELEQDRPSGRMEAVRKEALAWQLRHRCSACAGPDN